MPPPQGEQPAPAEAMQVFPPPTEAASQELTPDGDQATGDVWREVTLETVLKASEEIREAMGMTEARKERQGKPTRKRKPEPPFGLARP